jgi:hypothetical protein
MTTRSSSNLRSQGAQAESVYTSNLSPPPTDQRSGHLSSTRSQDQIQWRRGRNPHRRAIKLPSAQPLPRHFVKRCYTLLQIRGKGVYRGWDSDDVYPRSGGDPRRWMRCGEKLPWVRSISPPEQSMMSIFIGRRTLPASTQTPRGYVHTERRRRDSFTPRISHCHSRPESPMKNSSRKAVEGKAIGGYLTGDEVIKFSSRGAERTGGEVPVMKTQTARQEQAGRGHGSGNSEQLGRSFGGGRRPHWETWRGKRTRLVFMAVAPCRFTGDGHAKVLPSRSARSTRRTSICTRVNPRRMRRS